MRSSSVMHDDTYRQLEKQAFAVRERYGTGGQAMDPERVPKALHGVVPLVELLGVADDVSARRPCGCAFDPARRISVCCAANRHAAGRSSVASGVGRATRYRPPVRVRRIRVLRAVLSGTGGELDLRAGA